MALAYGKLSKFIEITERLSQRVAAMHARHDYVNVFQRGHQDLAALLGRPLDRASLLVLGCGYHYPDVALYAGVCERVVGIDVVGAWYRDGLWRTYTDMRRSGYHSSLGTFLKAVLDRVRLARYYRELARLTGSRLDHRAYELLSYDGTRIPCASESFDAILSNAVLEHVQDLNAVFADLHRVTKTDGLAYHLWHNYYSYSGGHASEALCREHPWGHLRGQYETRELNRATPNEIQAAFGRYFDVVALYQVDANHNKRGVDGDFAYEREELLTPALGQELQAYPREWLLTRAYLIVGKKKAAPIAAG